MALKFGPSTGTSPGLRPCSSRQVRSLHRRCGSQREAFKPTVMASASSDVPSTSISGGSSDAVSRRSALLQTLILPSFALVAPRRAAADELVDAAAPVSASVEIPAAAPVAPAPPPPAPKVPMKELYDPTLAYRFVYPVATLSGQPLSMVLAREPEKYSSAAPLTADARQRIVAELIDLRKYVSATVAVGPASGVLKGAPPSSWKPNDVALTVLIDKSTSRLSSGQRFALNDVEEAHREERGGDTYWVYEHVSQGSPTISSVKTKESYRHSLAVTAVRPGLDGTPYMYTLNLSCPQPLWSDLEPAFKQAVDSFRLVATTPAYIPPDKDPWQFW